MIHIDIITLGKLKETFWKEAEAEYLKRLSAFAKIQIHELREESFGEKDISENIKSKEAEKILLELKKIREGLAVIMDEHGREFSSVEFSKYLSEAAMRMNGQITFVIGGPLGLHETILQKAQTKISLSKMTFTHQMARVFLLEQIYRAMMIAAGKKYHW